MLSGAEAAERKSNIRAASERKFWLHTP